MRLATPVLWLALLLHQLELGTQALLLQSAGKQASQACECLNWKQTYSSANVSCGATNEFYTITQQTQWILSGVALQALRKGFGEEFCTQFYETIDDNYCVNINMGDDRGQWCFVDSACSSLHGGGPVHSGMKWKKCEKPVDKMLRHYKPEELASLAKASNLEMGLLHKLSYPLYQKALWKDVSAFWGVGVDSLKRVPLASRWGGHATLDQVRTFLKERWGEEGNLNADLRQELQQIMDSDEPFSFDTAEDDHPPHVIVKGKQVYVVFKDLVLLE